MNPWTVCILLLSLLLLWPVLCQRVGERRRVLLNTALACAAAFIILYATILTRTPGNYELILTPFAALSAARQQPELYREMLMNVFLFFPLGLTLSNALPRKWHRWGRIILTTFVGCALSAGIEYAQYRCALGLAETDDVICNTLGAFIGSTSLLIAHAIEKHKERAWHTNMTLTTTETQFLHIARAAISGSDLPIEKVDWPAVFALAGQQKLLPILFEAVRKMPAAGENAALFAVTKQQVIGQVLNQTVRSAEFAAASFRIARDYLGIDFDLPMPWDASIDVEPLLHDTLCGGVYGSNDLTRLHSSTVTLNAVKASRTGEKSSVLSTVFPKREYLERRYPYLKKRPYLLPVAWVQRIAHYASEKQAGTDNSASGSIKLGKERIELMKRYGIMD